MKAKVRKQFGSRCFRCGKGPRGLHFDHHRPLCKGYALVFGNVSILCASCNRLKSYHDPEAFYTRAELVRLNWLLAEQRNW